MRRNPLHLKLKCSSDHSTIQLCCFIVAYELRISKISTLCSQRCLIITNQMVKRCSQCTVQSLRDELILRDASNLVSPSSGRFNIDSATTRAVFLEGLHIIIWVEGHHYMLCHSSMKNFKCDERFRRRLYSNLWQCQNINSCTCYIWKEQPKGLVNHQSLIGNSGIEKQFCCSEPSCGRSFTSKFKLPRNSVIRFGELWFKCSVCESCFHWKDHLKNHQQIHNPNKALHSYECCNKKYSSLLSFRKHQAFHVAEAGGLLYKLVAGQEDIMYHLKVHSRSRALKGPTERKFKCDQCNRSFFTCKDVKRHMVVHTGVRNFLCQLCPKWLGCKDHLVQHIKKSRGAQQMTSHQGTLENATWFRINSVIIPSRHDQQCVTFTCNLLPVPLMQGIQYGAMKPENCFVASSDVLLGGNASTDGVDDSDGLLSKVTMERKCATLKLQD